MTTLREWLGRPVSGMSLAVLRACFGAVMVYQAYEFIEPIGSTNSLDKVTVLAKHVGKSIVGLPGESTVLDKLYTGENVHWNFGFPNFEWIRPLPEPWMSRAIVALGLVSTFLMIGLWTRLTAFLTGLIFTYAWTIETNWWNNHYYLSSLFCFLLAMTPCNRCLSVDRWLTLRRGAVGGQFDADVPFWTIFLFRSQMFLVYTYAALVKMNPDWITGEPVRMWFRGRQAAKPLAEVLSPPAMDFIYSILATEPVVFLFAAGGLLFDLSIGCMLMFRRTQLLALALVLLFHGTNYWIFNIGAFPFMGFTASLIFLDPDWPIRLASWMKRPWFPMPDPGWMLAGMLAIPIIGALLGWKLPPSTPSAKPSSPVGWTTVFLLALYLGVQLLLPLRHFTIAGDVHWTGEGSKFAWQMMARSHSGHILYRIQDPAWIAPDQQPYPKVDWPRIDGQSPDVLYRDINATNFDPDSLPEIAVVLEPFVGERICYNTNAKGIHEIEKVRDRVRQIWGSQAGQPPSILATKPLGRIIDEIVRRNQPARAGINLAQWDEFRAVGRDLTARIEAIRAAGGNAPTNLEDVLAFQAMLGRFLALAARLGMAEVLVDIYQCRPFDIFLGIQPDWFIIVDTNLQTRASGFLFTQMRWNQWPFRPANSLPSVFTDFTRMPSDIMHFLPKLMYGYDEKGQPVVVWNAERDLVPFQWDGHVAWGIMIHQYANQRIAEDWKAKTGVRPRVFAESYAKLNQHPMQPLVDPETDLASVPLRVWRHNPWILPLRFRNVVYHERGQPLMKLVEQP